MRHRKRILLIAATTGYQTRVFAEAGERLGYDIQLATDRCHVLDDPWGDHAIPLRFERPESTASVIAKFAAESGGFDGIVAVGDRPAVHRRARRGKAGAALQFARLRARLPQQVPRARTVPRRRTAGARVSPGRTGEDASVAAAGVEYPCVFKPLGFSASRGVIRANNPGEFTAAFDRIRRMLASPDIVRMHEDQDRFIQVEHYIEGHEFALEGLLMHGALAPVALFDKPDQMTGPYFEETIYTAPSRAASHVQGRDHRGQLRRAVRALGLSRGPDARRDARKRARRLDARSGGAPDRRTVRTGAEVRFRVRHSKR